MRRLLNALSSLALLASLHAATTHAAELHIELPSGTRTWNSSSLLSHPQTETISISADVAYKRDMQYRAIPLVVLLEGVAPGDHLQAVALDGFAAELPAAPLLATKGARAWLAIEDPQQPWPALAEGKPSAGPFYLVWQNPEAAQIGPEQWPFQVSRIRLLEAVAKRFPALLPAANANGDVQAGFAQFQKNCLACHRLNGAGDSQFGPDLNIPHNPTEYFAGDFLRQYIRDPQSLRRWPQGRMPAFSESVISDSQLEQLIGYLRHMSTRKTEH
ncbi:c-type cytochrome [Aquipseudomonas guryensis]|jgi:mono/diheme cytochrome c family protein|uniref:Cytochrome c n=1 Tax=Aquipseudomonas guryensis TaxID=2759165 RepID=A0A7W4DBI5_9GAMM|nr:cytochrome c [Pseudomonas guryensis]MBB1519557.1 cytochrome c [Pseudomonas guryensis]